MMISRLVFIVMFFASFIVQERNSVFVLIEWTELHRVFVVVQLFSNDRSRPGVRDEAEVG